MEWQAEQKWETLQVNFSKSMRTAVETVDGLFDVLPYVGPDRVSQRPTEVLHVVWVDILGIMAGIYRTFEVRSRVSQDSTGLEPATSMHASIAWPFCLLITRGVD
jgi:hypothetical protein